MRIPLNVVRNQRFFEMIMWFGILLSASVLAVLIASLRWGMRVVPSERLGFDIAGGQVLLLLKPDGTLDTGLEIVREDWSFRYDPLLPRRTNSGDCLFATWNLLIPSAAITLLGYCLVRHRNRAIRMRCKSGFPIEEFGSQADMKSWNGQGNRLTRN